MVKIVLFQDLDCVVTLVEKGAIPKGSFCTIVMVFDTPYEAYEVEYADDKGRTIGLEEYLPEELRLRE